MRKAYQNLKASHPNSKLANEDITIDASHLYIRFKPRDEAELDILNSDSTLALYSYPLDHEIPEGGDHYHDPEVPEGQPTYQYCAVPKGKQLTNSVAYEVLEELFIPEELPESRITSRSLSELLVTEALRITGNLEEGDKRSATEASRSRYTPKGSIKVWDDRAGRHVGVEGLEVRARRWFTTHEGTTDRNGNFTCDGTFSNKANYSYKYEKYHFSVRTGTFGQAELSGPKTRNAWHQILGGTGGTSGVRDAHQYYALIFQIMH
ncbi:hypothetical protein FKX85_03145 [Echinicola soli]|uniref:Uncharacterized protein n=1 Tax=Echinicola soli TaxID=2591634 RepID=A0A514CEK8_9BACT|nr:hypothetical protein [Echinicola soli]QDH78084.1 hypothetical protein FKX85_03145 [Echinicola soli]